MREEPVVTRTEHGAVRVLGAPWQIGTVSGDQVPIYRPPVSCDSVSPEAMEDGLSAAEMAELSAWHEAGHAVAAAAMGLTVTEVHVYADHPQQPVPGTGIGTGHTTLEHPPEPATPSALAAVVVMLLAGQLATQMWLEDRGALTPMRRLLTHVLSGADHRFLLEVTTPAPVAYLYGDVNPPAGWTGQSVRIDPWLPETKVLLSSRWSLLTGLAGHLTAHGHAYPADLEHLLYGNPDGLGGLECGNGW